MSQAMLKFAIKVAISQHSKKWKATKVYSIEVLQSIYDEQKNEGEMIISIKVKKK
jgi:hypothetical protein